MVNNFHVGMCVHAKHTRDIHMLHNFAQLHGTEELYMYIHVAIEAADRVQQWKTGGFLYMEGLTCTCTAG